MIVRPVAIGTRGSPLALAQARLVARALEGDGRRTRVVVIETDGDRRLADTAWGEGAFVAAIERALLDGRIDVAVHSAKDVPIEQDSRLRIAAYLPRADARDALVLPVGVTLTPLADLRPGTRIGTDSPRRTGFVRALRPDLVVHPLHGNVDTRLRRLDDGETDALILACAGLDRLGRADRISERLAPDTMPPAPGQGAIALQIRADDGRMLGLAAVIDDRRTRVAVEAERAFLEASGGGCRAPFGALATLEGPKLQLIAGHVEPDGSAARITIRSGPAAGGREAAVALAAELLAARRQSRSGPVEGGHVPPPGRRVLVPRTFEQSGELSARLAAHDLQAVTVPAVAVELDPPGGDLERAAGSLQLYRWVVVSSANGARAIVSAVARNPTELGVPEWAAIGAATAAILEAEGIPVTFRPSRADAATFARELPLERRDAVLVVRGNLAGDELADGLRERGAEVDAVVAYRTRIAPAPSRALLRDAVAAGPLDALILTSGSTVRGMLALAEIERIDLRTIPAICLGPETHRAAVEAGFRVAAVSPSPDAATVAATTAEALGQARMEIPDA